ncbi:MAG: LysR substrate-binding domain-containing protein [Pseudomonadota bacterium]
MDWKGLPPLAGLRAFEASARHLNHSAAAEELGVTHAAIAQQVRGLEQHLGQKLMRRAGRGMALTQEGAYLAENLTGGFGQIACAIDRLRMDEQDRPLNISMTPSFAVSWFMPRMHRFHQLHPGIEMTINPSSKVVDMTADRVDAAIRYGTPPWQGLEAERLVEANFVIAGAPELIGDREISGPESLVDLPWLQETETREVERWLADQGIDAPPKAQISEMPGYMMLAGLRSGQGIAATARLFIEEDIAAGRLVVLFEESGSAPRSYCLVTLPGAQRPALKSFVKWIRREARTG